MATEPKKHLVVVLGMHRSGTSAITRSLQTLGIDLGGDLFGPRPNDNDKGFFEDIDVIKLNEGLLEAIGEDWHSLASCLPTRLRTQTLLRNRDDAIALLEKKMANVEWFGIKDPRVVRLLPFWKDVFESVRIDVKYVLAIRNPLSVAASLAQRNGFLAPKSYYLWLQHVIPAVLETQGCQRVVLDFDRLMVAPESEIRRLAVEFGLADQIDEAALEDYVASFIEQGLRHTTYSLTDLNSAPGVPKLAVAAFTILSRAAVGGVSIDSQEVMSAFHEFAKEMDLLQPALLFMTETDKEVARLGTNVAQANQEITRLSEAVSEKDGQIAELTAVVGQRDRKIADLAAQLSDVAAQLSDVAA